MFREYVIDPASLSKWEDIRYVFSIFGWEKGRPITKYPKRWKKLVYDSLNCSVRDKKRVEEKLRRFKYIVRNNTSYDGKITWLDNVLSLHASQAFEKIISVNDHKNRCVTKMSDLYEDDLHKPTASVRREASEMADAIKLLLQTATTIKFVDKHFDPFAPRFQNVMNAMLGLLSQTNYKGTSKIEFYSSSDKSHGQTLCNNIHEWIITRTSIPVTTIILPFGTMHNRYIISDKSGITLGTGLDEATRNHTQEDDIPILDIQRHKDLFDEFSSSRKDILYKNS